MQRGAANPGCSRLSRRLVIEHRKRSCCCTGETSLTGKRGRLKGGCSQDWLPHVAFPKTCKHPFARTYATAPQYAELAEGIAVQPNILNKVVTAANATLATA